MTTAAVGWHTEEQRFARRVFGAFAGVVFAAYLLIPFYKLAVQPYVPIDLTILLAIACALLPAPWLLTRRRGSISQAGLLLWVVLAMLVLAGVLWAPDARLAMGGAINYQILLTLPLWAGGMVVASSEGSLRAMLLTFYFVGALTVTFGLFQLSADGRLTVLEQNTIQTARAAMFLPIIGVGLIAGASRRLVTLATVALIPPAFLIAIASGSRGPLLIVGILAFFAAARYFTKPATVNWNAVLVSIALLVATVAVISVAADDLPGASTERFSDFGQFLQGILGGDGAVGEADTSSASRVALLDVAGRLYAEHPVLGVGTSGYEALSPRLLGSAERYVYPHNAVMQFAAEYGTVGVVLFVVFVALAMTRRLPQSRAATTVRWLSLFFILNAMVSGDIFEDRALWGLTLALLLIPTQQVWNFSKAQLPVGDPPAMVPALQRK